jgi:hypothetical protein
MFVAIYGVVALIVVWGAGRITDHAVDVRFYRDFLLPWEMRIVALRYKHVDWPAFEAHNPSAYMQALISLMKAYGIDPPESNTERRYIYRLTKFGGKANRLLIVYHDNRLIIYGLPRMTFDRLDRLIDGKQDPGDGNFTGRWGADRLTRIGYLKI